MRRLFYAVAFFFISQLAQGQVRDTLVRDIGANVAWRSLVLDYPETNTAADIVRNLQFAVETRAWRFWIQTGVMVGWNRSRRIEDEYNIDVFATMCYEFPVFRRRVVLGVGPIATYYHHYSIGSYWVGGPEVNLSNFGSVGVNFEITVPIWRGLSMETCSDIGVGFNSYGAFPRIMRLVSVGINYRFKAYPI